MEKTRNYGVDLLRIIFMFMVCILHVLNQGGIVYIYAKGTLQNNVFMLFETISYCAVDGYAFISGYMAKNKPRNNGKIVEMWTQAFFYSFVITIILTVFGLNKSMGMTDIIKLAFPVTFNVFWYFTAYFILFLAIPFINKFIFDIDENVAKKAFVIIVVLFSVLNILTDPFQLQDGCSITWIVLMYILGALARRIKLFENKTSLTLIIMLLICNIVPWVEVMLGGFGLLINNISPTVLFSGIILVVLFSRIKVKGNIISKISPLVFGVYLFQINPIIWEEYIKNAFLFVANRNIFVGVVNMLLLASIIFISGLIVEFIRSKISNLMKIPSLSKQIVEEIERFIISHSSFLK